MDIIYSSELYILVHHSGLGIEIVDKFRRASYMVLLGMGAEEFDTASKAFITKNNPSEEQMDEFLEPYANLCNQPVVLH